MLVGAAVLPGRDCGGSTYAKRVVMAAGHWCTSTSRAVTPLLYVNISSVNGEIIPVARFPSIVR